MKKAVLITGATSGLGLEYAKIFSRQYAHLILVARNEKKLYEVREKLQKKYAIDVQIFSQDLSEKDAAANIFEFVKEKELNVEVLINNAGFGDYGYFAEGKMEKQRKLMQVNMLALTELTRLFLPEMLKKKSGKILNIASVAAFEPGPLMAIYYASKAYVLSFTQALAVEVKGSGVTVTALCPGPMKTGFEKRAELGNSGLFKNIKNLSVKKVAKMGYIALMKGKTIVVPGIESKVIVYAAKLAPRKLVSQLVYQVQK